MSTGLSVDWDKSYQLFLVGLNLQECWICVLTTTVSKVILPLLICGLYTPTALQVQYTELEAWISNIRTDCVIQQGPLNLYTNI